MNINIRNLFDYLQGRFSKQPEANEPTTLQKTEGWMECIWETYEQLLPLDFSPALEGFEFEWTVGREISLEKLQQKDYFKGKQLRLTQGAMDKYGTVLKLQCVWSKDEEEKED